MPIFNEQFIKSFQKSNDYCYIKAMGILKGDKNYIIHRNGSPTIVIGCITSGIMIFDLDDENKDNVIFAHQGDTFILKNNFEYKMYSDKNNPPSMIWINMTGDLPIFLLERHFPGKNLILAAKNSEKEINEIINLAAKEDDTRNEIALCIHSLILNLDNSIINPIAETCTQNTSPDMEQYIINSIQFPFSLKTLSEKFNLSKSQITRIFIEKYNCTPYKFYQNIRHNIAKSLLQNTTLTIDDIAQRLNFYDRNHFTASFISHEKIAPAAFRKKTK